MAEDPRAVGDPFTDKEIEQMRAGVVTEHKRCRHCGVEIRLVNYVLGEEWRHNPYPHRDWHGYLYCKRTVAEPEVEGS